MILFTLTYIPLLGINWISTYYSFGKLSTPLWRKDGAVHALGAVHSLAVHALEAVDAPEG